MKYAGIGSRRTPYDILAMMRNIANDLSSKGYTCRTGGALGADKAFIDGSSDSELWLPWDGYNGYYSDLPEPTEVEEAFAAKYHPNWKACKQGARKMHARNCNIVLGEDLDDPVDFIVCWTPEAKLEGGTAQALRIAIDYDIPVFNLGDKAGSPYILNKLIEFVKNNEKQHRFSGN